MTLFLIAAGAMGTFLWIRHGLWVWRDPKGAPFWYSNSNFHRLEDGAPEKIVAMFRLMVRIRRWLGLVEIGLGLVLGATVAIIAGMEIAALPPTLRAVVITLLVGGATYLYLTGRR